MRRLLVLLSALTLGGATVFAATRPSLSHRADALVQSQLASWEEEQRGLTVQELRSYNAEWDFMYRTFTVLTLADVALADPARQAELLPVIDSLIQDTLAQEAAHGQRHYLMDYVDLGTWVNPEGRSVFVDGEIALMLGARRMVSDDRPDWAQEHRARVAQVVKQLEASPALLGESYPNEVWLFCVTNGLVAARMADQLDGSDHSGLIRRWVSQADRRLREKETGLLGSEFTWDGRMMDGPEGSSIWLIAVNLQVLSPKLAQDQYERAHEQLIETAAGMAWAKEWGSGWQGPVDVDSGPIVPVIDASPSSSGFALLAAKAFGDDKTFGELSNALHAADLVVKLDPRLAALADNAVGDAVLAHALTFGPLWERLKEGEQGE